MSFLKQPHKSQGFEDVFVCTFVDAQGVFDGSFAFFYGTLREVQVLRKVFCFDALREQFDDFPVGGI